MNRTYSKEEMLTDVETLFSRLALCEKRLEGEKREVTMKMIQVFTWVESEEGRPGELAKSAGPRALNIDWIVAVVETGVHQETKEILYRIDLGLIIPPHMTPPRTKLSQPRFIDPSLFGLVVSAANDDSKEQLRAWLSPRRIKG
jgi:hypothetical protein